MMGNKTYQQNHTISLLCEHKQQYQKNILFAWLIVIVLTAIVCWLLMNKNDSHRDINYDPIILSSTNSASNQASENYPPSYGPPGSAHIKSGNSYFPSGGKVKYTIIKEQNPSFTPAVEIIYPDLDAGLDLNGLTDIITGMPAISYGDDDDFGLPVDSSLTFYNGRHIRNLTPDIFRIDIPDKSRIAIIDWVHPSWPKKGSGWDAVVVIAVTINNEGKKDYRVLKEEPKGYGFAVELMEAINESIFWPAKDIYGRQLDGKYLITYEFCYNCKERIVEIVSGDVVIKPKRSY